MRDRLVKLIDDFCRGDYVEKYIPIPQPRRSRSGIERRCGEVKYRKKPVIVEAYQTNEEMVIHTLEGDMKASVGDYIITGVNGEQYPCKPDVFEKSYEQVKGGEQE